MKPHQSVPGDTVVFILQGFPHTFSRRRRVQAPERFDDISTETGIWRLELTAYPMGIAEPAPDQHCCLRRQALIGMMCEMAEDLDQPRSR